MGEPSTLPAPTTGADWVRPLISAPPDAANSDFSSKAVYSRLGSFGIRMALARTAGAGQVCILGISGRSKCWNKAADGICALCLPVTLPVEVLVSIGFNRVSIFDAWKFELENKQ